MRTFILTFLFSCVVCFGQELPSPCDVIVADYSHVSVLVSSSDNGRFLARLEWGGETNKSQAFIFEWVKESYVLRKEFVLGQGFPSRLMISDSGNMVFIGKKNAKTNIDEVNIYSQKKGLVKTIASTQQHYSSESESCMLRKPWICWGYPIGIVGESLNLLDLNGNEVDIDLVSGQYKKSRSIDVCENYH